jgi:hypothetical protein
MAWNPLRYGERRQYIERSYLRAYIVRIGNPILVQYPLPKKSIGCVTDIVHNDRHLCQRVPWDCYEL